MFLNGFLNESIWMYLELLNAFWIYLEHPNAFKSAIWIYLELFEPVFGFLYLPSVCPPFSASPENGRYIAS